MTALQIEKIRENVRAFKIDTFKFHGEEAIQILDEVDTEICEMALASKKYINISNMQKHIKALKAEIENIIYPANEDIEASIIRNDGSDVSVEVR